MFILMLNLKTPKELFSYSNINFVFYTIILLTASSLIRFLALTSIVYVKDVPKFNMPISLKELTSI